jgi:diacylglycerol kinase family enzyme
MDWQPAKKSRCSPNTRYLVVVNKESGTVRSLGVAVVEKAIADGFAATGAAAGHADVRFVAGRDLVPTVVAARDECRHDIIVVGGGDGSLASAAAALSGSDSAVAISKRRPLRLILPDEV